MNGLSEIYTELIAEESRNPENRRHLPHPTCCEKGHNPSCGDEITLELEVQDGRIADASFTGNGCAISQASASLMINLIKGQSVEKAGSLIALFGRTGGRSGAAKHFPYAGAGKVCAAFLANIGKSVG